MRALLLLLVISGCTRSRTDQEEVLRLCGLPAGSKVTAFRAAPPAGGWQREGLTISATIEPAPGWSPGGAGYASGPVTADRDVALRQFPALGSALFDDASWVRCVTAGNNVLHATSLVRCSAKPAIIDVVVCAVRQTSVQVELRAAY